MRATAACLAAAAALGCASAIGEAPAASIIEIAPYSASVEVGKSLTLFASVLDAGGRVITAGAPITWISSAPSVATIDARGVVTGVSPGEARITARQGGVAGSAAVTVVVPIPARVEIPIVATSLERGDTLRITALALSDAGAAYSGRGFSWSSDNVSVAAVAASADSTAAVITAIAPGIAVISATNRGVTGSVTIEVVADPVIDVGVGTVALQGVQRGGDPAPQLVTITNAGGGTLRGLDVSTITYEQETAGWLQAAIVTLPEGPRLRLSAALSGLGAGNYSAIVTVASTAPAVAPRTVNVSLSVAPPPLLTVSGTTVSFGAAAGGSSPAPQEIAITNSGGGTLAGLNVAAPVTPSGQPASWLSATLSGTSAPATLTLQANASGLAVGTYAARVTLAAIDADGSPTTIDVSLVVSQNAAIALTPTAVTLLSVVGSNPPQATVAVSNGGGGSLSGLSLGPVQYGAGGATGWLVASLATSGAPTQVTITASTTALAQGTYSGSFEVRSSLPGVSAATIAVTLSVRAAAVIVASPASVALTATGGTPSPSRVVGVSNGGSGPLSGITSLVSYAPNQSTGWLSATFPGGPATAPAAFTMQALSGSLAVGNYNATVRLSSPDAPAPTDVDVTLAVVGKLQPTVPAIAIFGALGDGASTTQATSIVNAGAGFIGGLTTSVTYNSGTGWLSRSLTSSTTPTTLVAQANADPAAPRGTSSAVVTISGNNVAPVSVLVSRTIGYTYSRHLVGLSTNIFDASKLGCTNCHTATRVIPFASYSSMLSNGYIRSPVTTAADSATTRVYYYVTDPAYGHGGGVYPRTNPWITILRDWISDGSRQ